MDSFKKYAYGDRVVITDGVHAGKTGEYQYPSYAVVTTDEGKMIHVLPRFVDAVPDEDDEFVQELPSCETETSSVDSTGGANMSFGGGGGASIGTRGGGGTSIGTGTGDGGGVKRPKQSFGGGDASSGTHGGCCAASSGTRGGGVGASGGIVDGGGSGIKRPKHIKRPKQM